MIVCVCECCEFVMLVTCFVYGGGGSYWLVFCNPSIENLAFFFLIFWGRRGDAGKKKHTGGRRQPKLDLDSKTG